MLAWRTSGGHASNDADLEAPAYGMAADLKRKRHLHRPPALELRELHIRLGLPASDEAKARSTRQIFPRKDRQQRIAREFGARPFPDLARR